jgi:Transglutaminase-like superfamily/Bacterial transglutaminase-like N-terminal region
MNKQYQILYHTHNSYEEPVKEATFAFLVAPCQDAHQTVRHLSFRNSLGEESFQYRNAFGFEVKCIRSAKRFTEFEFHMQVEVEKKPKALLPEGQLSVPQEQEILASPKTFIDHHLFLGFDKYTTLAPAWRDRVLWRHPEQPVFDFLQQLNTYIYQLLQFDPVPTHVHTTVNEVLELGRGVCQDYTHLFLTMARLNKIPCRYVSGYLNQGSNLTGAAVMHAWVEAFLPSQGWFGFDPTNNLLTDVNYIKAAHGADYSDCSPIKGVLRTNGGHKTAYGVKVIPAQVEEDSQ